MKSRRLLVSIPAIALLVFLLACRGECTINCKTETGYISGSETTTFNKPMSKDECADHEAVLEAQPDKTCNYDWGD